MSFLDKLLNGKYTRSTREQRDIFNTDIIDLLREEAYVKNNGIDNIYTINFSLVNSKAYHDKFERLSEKRIVNEAMYKRAAKMFEHRNGSKYEDIAMLDARTGEQLVENITASGEYEFTAGLTKEQSAYLTSLNRPYEILHNHPNSTPPSIQDIFGLFDRKLAVASTVFGHDGSIYRMEKLDPNLDITEYIKRVRNKAKNTYPDWPNKLIDSITNDNLLKALPEDGLMNYIRR